MESVPGMTGWRGDEGRGSELWYQVYCSVGCRSECAVANDVEGYLGMDGALSYVSDYFVPFFCVVYIAIPIFDAFTAVSSARVQFPHFISSYCAFYHSGIDLWHYFACIVEHGVRIGADPVATNSDACTASITLVCPSSLSLILMARGSGWHASAQYVRFEMVRVPVARLCICLR